MAKSSNATQERRVGLTKTDVESALDDLKARCDNVSYREKIERMKSGFNETDFLTNTYFMGATSRRMASVLATDSMFCMVRITRDPGYTTERPLFTMQIWASDSPT